MPSSECVLRAKVIDQSPEVFKSERFLHFCVREEMTSREVLVLGSINVDFVAYCIDDTLPQPGQTVFGTLFEKNYGGKGANQAVQVARLGCSVEMIGQIGPDEFGKDYLVHLGDENVGSGLIEVAPNVSTGIAQITVSSAGENMIVIIPGANAEVSESFALKSLGQVSEYRLLLCQNEIPFDSTCAALKYASQHGIRTIFNPAPAPAKDPSFFLNRLNDCKVDIICPNETELSLLTGGLPTEREDDVEDAARKLLGESGCRTVVVTRGSKGAYILSDDEKDITRFIASDRANEGVSGVSRFISTDKVTDVVDTTGAGDSFIGSLAAHLSRGASIVDGVYCALRIASQSVLEQGAQVSYKCKSELAPDICPPDMF